MNMPSIARLVLQWGAVAGALVMLGGAGCQSTGPTVISNELPFDQAVIEATDGLVAQTQKLPAFLAKVEAKVAKKALIIDPMIDASSGQQTRVTRQLEQKVSDRLGSQHPQFEVLPFQAASLARAQYLLTGTMVRSAGGAAGGARKPFQINLALVELSTRSVLAQASALARDDGLDTSPTPYYQDSPVLVKDQVVEGYIRTAQTPPGQAADAYYIERLSAAVLINDGTNAYNASQYQDALGLYRNALTTSAGEQLRALNGVYLASWKLGPHRRRRTGLRPRGRVRPEPAQPGREVPVQPGQHRVLVGPQSQRALCAVAAPDRAPGQRGEGVHERGRPHQPHGLGTDQRPAVASARRRDQAKARCRCARSGQPHEGQRHGLA